MISCLTSSTSEWVLVDSAWVLVDSEWVLVDSEWVLVDSEWVLVNSEWVLVDSEHCVVFISCLYIHHSAKWGEHHGVYIIVYEHDVHLKIMNYEL